MFATFKTNRERFLFEHQEPYKPVNSEPLGTVQAAGEQKDAVLDHLLPV